MFVQRSAISPLIRVLLETSIIFHAPETLKLMSAVIGVFPQSVTLYRRSAVMNIPSDSDTKGAAGDLSDLFRSVRGLSEA